MSDPVVLFSEHKLDGGGVLGHIRLNAPKSFNSLTLEMVQLIQAQLDQWQQQGELCAIFMDGTGEKAFCAGGDVKSLYKGRVDSTGKIDNPEAIRFFDLEYSLDYSLHTFPKPIICWGNGVVMGGGLGLMTGCEHRIVTESTRSAMPEITIGLFPDVGGSWFLNRAPGKTGLFLGLTGANINAHDAIYSGLANRFVLDEFREAFFEGLCALKVSDFETGGLTEYIKAFESKSRSHLPESELKTHIDLIDSVCDFEKLEDVFSAIVEQCSQESSKWLQGAANILEGGCPITAHLVFEQLKRGKYLSLSEVFDMERCISAACMRAPDFYEGVRALLIDKDKNPQWSHQSVSDVPPELIESYFK